MNVLVLIWKLLLMVMDVKTFWAHRDDLLLMVDTDEVNENVLLQIPSGLCHFLSHACIKARIFIVCS